MQEVTTHSNLKDTRPQTRHYFDYSLLETILSPFGGDLWPYNLKWVCNWLAPGLKEVKPEGGFAPQPPNSAPPPIPVSGLWTEVGSGDLRTSQAVNFSQECHRNSVSNAGFFVTHLQHEALKHHPLWFGWTGQNGFKVGLFRLILPSLTWRVELPSCDWGCSAWK